MKTQPNILVIEPEAAILDLVRDVLSPCYNILTAQDVLEGVDLLMTERLDLLIIDAILPVVSGTELIRIIREQESFSQILIIAFASQSEEHFPLDPAHVQAILPKMFSIDALARTVSDRLKPVKEQAERFLTQN